MDNRDANLKTLGTTPSRTEEYVFDIRTKKLRGRLINRGAGSSDSEPPFLIEASPLASFGDSGAWLRVNAESHYKYYVFSVYKSFRSPLLNVYYPIRSNASRRCSTGTLSYFIVVCSLL